MVSNASAPVAPTSARPSAIWLWAAALVMLACVALSTGAVLGVGVLAEADLLGFGGLDALALTELEILGWLPLALSGALLWCGARALRGLHGGPSAGESPPLSLGAGRAGLTVGEAGFLCKHEVFGAGPHDRAGPGGLRPPPSRPSRLRPHPPSSSSASHPPDPSRAPWAAFAWPLSQASGLA